MKTRRDFLKDLSIGGGLCLTGIATGCGREAAPVDTSTPTPTPVSEGTNSLGSIGVQLYTVREEMKKDFEGTLEKIAALGYKEVEFAGYYDRTPDQVRAVLERNRLAAPATHIPIEQLRSNLPQTIAAAKTIGHQYIICPWLDDVERIFLDDYRKHAALFNRVGAACRKAGIQFAYHNHEFEFESFDGQMPYDLLLKECDAELVKMELDLYWIARGGQDALAYFDNHPGRFPLVHVKDLERGGIRAVEVGQGSLNFGAIFAQSEKAGIKHYFVEQDEPADALANIRTSIEYLKNLRF
ncbi:MAG: sugar phosphate isomerase/epimerase [Acidobacteria bacterium]|nr:sugar phosphate isomerase/epimerase [Acidobacteriota bacterium]MCW5969056.1 sugar phosphate isomerase/epimerase [Blastocatellales bacterium]